LQEYLLTGDQERFERKGSSILVAMYWGKYQRQRWQLDYGVMYSGQKPNTKAIIRENQDIATDIGRIDANGIALPPVMDTLSSQQFRAIRFGITPSWNWFGPLNIGMRVDHIRYLDPNSHLNTQEVQFTTAQQAIVKRIGATNAPIYRQGPSRWESEAVNATVFSPMISLRYLDVFQFNIIYSHGIYSNPILRHGEIAKTHGGFSLNASAKYHIATGSL